MAHLKSFHGCRMKVFSPLLPPFSPVCSGHISVRAFSTLIFFLGGDPLSHCCCSHGACMPPCTAFKHHTCTVSSQNIHILFGFFFKKKNKIVSFYTTKTCASSLKPTFSEKMPVYSDLRTLFVAPRVFFPFPAFGLFASPFVQ